jgi:hypothetical protein
VNGPIPIRTLGEFRETIDSGRLLVITDTADGVRLHTDPDGCSYVREDSFETKVLGNSERNGAYFSVASLDEALAKWPDLSICRSVACAGR